jgi:hypothetical protein
MEFTGGARLARAGAMSREVASDLVLRPAQVVMVAAKPHRTFAGN